MTDMTKQTEAISTERALKLALEALEIERNVPRLGPVPTKTSKAITALREALTSGTDWASEAKEQPAQQKLVPYEPSIDMQEQGSIASGYDLSQARAKKVYQAMIDMHDVMMEREPTDEWFRLQAGYPEQPAPATELREQKPVAWLDPWTRNNVTTDYDAYGKHGIPLYTSPPASKPLTDEEIKSVIQSIDPAEEYLPRALQQFARAIEAAHGIKERNT